MDPTHPPQSSRAGQPAPGAEPDVERPLDGIDEPAAEAGERDVEEIVRSKTRSERSAKDMALSLLVLLVPIALLVGFHRLVLDGDRPVTVDPAAAVDQARAAGAFPVSDAPRPGDEWSLTSAVFRAVDGGSVLRLGYVTPAGRGLQLVQSDVPAERLLPAELDASVTDVNGVVQLGGRSWQRYGDRSEQRALVLLEPDRTVIVRGGAAERELRELAGSVPPATIR